MTDHRAEVPDLTHAITDAIMASHECMLAFWPR